MVSMAFRGTENRAFLLGWVAREPTFRQLTDGDLLCYFTVVTYYGRKLDNKTYTDVEAFGRSAEVVRRFIERGSFVMVSGPVITNQWKDEDGRERRETRVRAWNVILARAERIPCRDAAGNKVDEMTEAGYGGSERK